MMQCWQCTVMTQTGGNKAENNEMMLQLKSKSKTDKKETSIMIDENGGRFDSLK